MLEAGFDAERASPDAQVVCVGETLLHLVAEGPLAEAGSYAVEAGGAAVEVALSLARRGLAVRVSAPVGDDGHAGRLASALEARGVDARGLVRVPGKKTSLLFVARGAERGVLPYRDLELESEVDARAVEGARHLHLASVLPSLEHLRALAALARSARARGVRVSLDLNARPQLFRAGASLGFHAALAELVAELDWLKASEDDLRLLGVDAAALGGWLPPRAWLFLTLAERGLEVFGPRGSLERDAPREVEGGMGAGDAFAAELVHSFEPEADEAAFEALLERAQRAAIERLERGSPG